MRPKNKLKARAKRAERSEQFADTEQEYCQYNGTGVLPVQRYRSTASTTVQEYCQYNGKVCHETRASAEQAARSISHAHRGSHLSVYICDACGKYHVTKAGYSRSKEIRQDKLRNRGILYE